MSFKIFGIAPNISSGNLICVDLSSETLKMALAKSSANKKEIVGLAIRDIRSLADPDISKLIRSILNDTVGFKNPNIINIIPSPLVITRNIEVPSRDPNEIEEIINLQASRLTPYAREDIIIDYVNIGVYRKSYTKLLLITVARNLIKKQLDVLHGAGLRVERVCFSAEAVALFIWGPLKAQSDEGLVNILHIDSHVTDFIIAQKGKIIFVRGIPIGIEHLTQSKEQYQLRFIEEVKKSLEAYSAEDIEQAVQKIIMVGITDKTKDLESLLHATLHIPISSSSYFKGINMTPEVSQAVAAGSASFLNVIAPIMVSDEIKLNLIPEEIKFRKLLEEKGRDIVKSGILIMMTFILVCAVLISNIYFRNLYFKKLNAQYEKAHQEAGALEKDFSRVQAVRNYASRRGYSLYVLDELYNMVSASVQLNDIKFDRQGKFAIKGSAETMAAVFSLVDDMGKSLYFKDVKTKYTTKRKEGDKDLVDFEITSLLKEAK